MIKIIKDLLAPKKCYSCQKEWTFFCEKCFKKIEKKYYFDQVCYVCKKYSKNFEVHKECKNSSFSSPLKRNFGVIFYDKTIIMTHYKIKVIKKLILNFKFYHKKDVWEDLAVFLADKFIKYSKEELKNYKKEDFLVIPAPMSFFRKLVRWYNQADILAKNLAKILNFPYDNKIIFKSKYTKQQASLNRQKRLTNLKNSFKIAKKKTNKVDKKIIILVDDVISTWTTLNEISKILKIAWAQKIITLTIASGY